MTTRSQMKTRYSRYPRASDFSSNDEEIIDLNEPSSYQSKVYQRRGKEHIENFSSEATTPNKGAIKKKKINKELIEIREVKDSGKSMKNKRENSKMAKREAKGKNKSVDKIVKNNIINNKKGKNVKSINLDEDDTTDDIKEIRITSTNTIRLPKKNIHQNNSKAASRTPDKTFKGKSKKKINAQKNKKINNKNIKKEITQYELSSSEENENEVNINITQDSKKSSKAMKRPSNIEEKNSKTTIKVLKEINEDVSDKSFLNKKRRNERNVKSRTPNKLNKPKFNIANEEIPNELNNNSTKIRSGKSSSRTPVKNSSKNMKNILQPESSNNTDNNKNNNNYVSPELAFLNHLTVEYGFEKVLDSLCKNKLNKKNKLDVCVQGLRESCTNEKLPLFLIKMMFSYFDNKEKEKDKDKEKKAKLEEEKSKEKPLIKETKKSLSYLKSTSPENTTTNNELIDPSEKLISKSPTKASNSNVINTNNNNIININDKQEESVTPMIIDENTIPPIHLTEESPKKIEKVPEKKKEEKEKEKEKSPIKAKNEEVKKEKKNLSIGSHYHKDEDGLIYKYQVYKLDGQGNAIFKCYDDKCSSEGMYDLDSRKFSVTVKHNLKYNEHDYVINNDKNEDNVFKEMINLNKKEAQVYKEGNERTVKLY